jgi:hypothetical protein
MRFAVSYRRRPRAASPARSAVGPLPVEVDRARVERQRSDFQIDRRNNTCVVSEPKAAIFSRKFGEPDQDTTGEPR